LFAISNCFVEINQLFLTVTANVNKAVYAPVYRAKTGQRNQLFSDGGFMPDTLLSSLSSTLKLTTREEIARFLGESEPAVSRGFEFATSAVFDGLRLQTGQSDVMRQVIDLASKAPADIGAALNTSQLGNPNSPLILGGKKFLSSVLGQGQEATLSAIGRESGLRPTSAATVLALAAQSVLSFIGARVRNDGMTATSLATFLHSEGSAVGGGSAAEFHQAPAAPRVTAPTETVTTRRVEINPVIAQTVQKERSVWLWLLPLLLILAGLLLWFLFRPRPATVAEAPAPPPAAAPVASPRPNLGSFVPRQLVDGTMLNIPEHGVEGRLLAFIQDPAQKPNKTSWFDFDRLLFATGSATLQPQSMEQLHNIAAILKAYPATHLTIGGYTDNTGDATQNLKLSQDRADNVTAELVKLGVASDRLIAKGYGEEHPVGDNATEAGRAQNRRISMLVTQK
jgi:outer membrane protein OmpA-like peptidoglycan-associated protein